MSDLTRPSAKVLVSKRTTCLSKNIMGSYPDLGLIWHSLLLSCFGHAQKQVKVDQKLMLLCFKDLNYQCMMYVKCSDQIDPFSFGL